MLVTDALELENIHVNVLYVVSLPATHYTCMYITIDCVAHYNRCDILTCTIYSVHITIEY